MTTNACVAMLYWPFVKPAKEIGTATTVFDVYLHSVNYVLLLIDLFVVAFPVRLLHTPYSSIVAIFYGIFTYVLWRAGGTNAVYPFLDWADAPGRASGFMMITALIGTPILQTVTFGLFLIRKRCNENCCRASNQVNDCPETHNLKDYDSRPT